MAEENSFKLKISLTAFFSAVLILFLFLRFYFQSGNERLCALIILLKVCGLFVSWILVLGTLDAPLFKRFCPHSPWFDCRKVINSPAGKIFNLIHTADLGVLYFGGSLLALIFSAFSYFFYFRLVFLALLNLLTLPYTLFSVLYQAFIIKKWCALCLIVQAIFWLEFWQFLPFLTTRQIALNFSLPVLTPLLTGFAIPLALWPLMRFLLSKAYPEKND